MTVAELMALPEVPRPDRAVWREADDPVLIEDDEGRAWSTFRVEGKLVRHRAPEYDRRRADR